MHIYSPRIEMYAQMAADRGVQCSTTVEVDGELVCSVEKLKNVLQRISVSFYSKIYVHIHFKKFKHNRFYRPKVQNICVKHIT